MPRVSRPSLLDGSFHTTLLRDEARLDGYARALAQLVRPGDVVADIGSGSGILAYFAAKAGASRVHAVEQNTNSYAALLRHVRRNGLSGTVVPILADGTEWTPPGPVDVVVCELMETGLLHESIAAVMRNVHAWEPKPRAILPARVELFAEGVEVQEDYRGYRASFSGWRSVAGDVPLTERARYSDLAFDQEAPPEGVDVRVEMRVLRAGTLGGLQLTTDSHLAPGVTLGASPAYCTPLVLALEEPMKVEEGERLRVALAYEFAYTAEPLTFEISRT